MNNIYNEGNYILNYSLNGFNFIVNPNYTNYSVYYVFDTLFKANNENLSLSLILNNETNFNNMKLDIYMNIIYSNNKYFIYDAYNNYDELEYVETINNIDLYKNDNYSLYILNSNYKYKVINNFDKTEYLINEYESYPSKITFLNGVIYNITLNNHKVIEISEGAYSIEKITITYSTNEISFNYYRNNQLLYVTTTNNSTNKITYKISENNTYTLEEISINIIGPESISFIQMDGQFIYQIEDNNKISAILFNNQVDQVLLSINNGYSKITKYGIDTYIYYDTLNRKRYIRNDKYYKIIKYDNKNRIICETEDVYIDEPSLIPDLGHYEEITYSAEDDDDEFDYSFSFTHTSQTINPEYNNIISSNDIYRATGYGDLVYLKNLYGEKTDTILVILYVYPVIHNSFYVELKYQTNVSNTIGYVYNSFINPYESGFIPIVISIKPKYHYSQIQIKFQIYGDYYITSPKVIKTNLAHKYSYNNNNLLYSEDNNDGKIIYTYNSNNLITKVENEKETIEYIRNNNSINVSQINYSSYNEYYTYDNQNRILTKTTGDTDISYTYNQNSTIETIKKNISSNEYNETVITTTKDNYGRITSEKTESRVVINNQVGNLNEISYYQYGYSNGKLNTITKNNTDISLTYNDNKITSAGYDNDNIYSFYYDIDKVKEVKYYDKYITKRTYTNYDNLTYSTFNGTYRFYYNNDNSLSSIRYNNVTRYTMNYDNRRRLINDGYNQLTLDGYDNVLEDLINNKQIKYNYIDNSISHIFEMPSSVGINLRIYSNNNVYRKNLYSDPYYANITYNSNSNVKSVSTNNLYVSNINGCDIYPFSNSLTGINDLRPISMSKQEYELFYYDKDINNYALCLYGIYLEYNVGRSNEFQIEVEIKLEQRNSNQIIFRIPRILLFRNIYNEIIIQLDSTIYYTSIMASSDWHKIKLVISDKIYLYVDNLTYEINNQIFIGSNSTIRIGTYTNYNQMTTFGLLRNLVITDITPYSYYQISQSNSYDINNNLIKEEIRSDNNIIYSKTNTITTETQNSVTYVKYFENVSSLISTRIHFLNNMVYGMEMNFSNSLLAHKVTYIYKYDTELRIDEETVQYPNNQEYKRKYLYDSNNNIIRINDINNSSNYETFTYNSVYKYRLDSYTVVEGQNITNYPITYDNITGLLPISFMGNTYSYEGRKLISYNNYNYEYNIYGRRIRKYTNDNSINIYYYYDLDNKLILEDRGSYKIRYLYDTNNQIYGFIREDMTDDRLCKSYFYLKNKLGIIYGILTDEGTLLGTYRYNAFGKILEIKQNNDIYGLMNINPFRYKSYYYDIEYNMYYLNNRYYNPLICRFIIADNHEYIDLKEKNSYNIYVYCNNNPVLYADPEWQLGIIATLIIGTIVGAAIGAGFAAGEGIINNGLNQSDWDWRNIGAGALVGTATIAIGTSGAAYFGAYSIQQIGTNNWNFNDALINGTKGLWKGFISFGMGYLGGKIGVMNGIDKTISNRFYSNVPMTNLRFLTCASQSLIGEGKTKLIYSAITGLIRWFL